MINQTVSFGIFMMLESMIILFFIGDLIRRTGLKLWTSRHQHVTWDRGRIFMAYLFCVLLFNISESYSVLMNYVINQKPLALEIVTSRVFGRTVILIAKFLLWYYSIKGGFDLFRKQ